MTKYDWLMKEVQRFLSVAVASLIILMLGVQIGLYKERSSQTAQAINAMMDKKDREIDKLNIALNVVMFDLEVEKEKLSILACESEVRHDNIWGDGGRAYGIAQWHFATFKELREKAGRPELRWENIHDQIWLLDWALRNGYGKKWTCFQKGKNKNRNASIQIQQKGVKS